MIRVRCMRGSIWGRKRKRLTCAHRTQISFLRCGKDAGRLVSGYYTVPCLWTTYKSTLYNVNTYICVVSDFARNLFFCSITRLHLVKADGLFGRSPYSSSCICMLSKTTSVVEANRNEISRGMCAKLLERATLEYATANTVFDCRKLNELREFFLTVTSYRYNIARLHSLFYGRAAPVYLVMRPEECELSPQRLDFIYYESSRIFRICLLAKSSWKCQHVSQ